MTVIQCSRRAVQLLATISHFNCNRLSLKEILFTIGSHTSRSNQTVQTTELSDSQTNGHSHPRVHSKAMFGHIELKNRSISVCSQLAIVIANWICQIPSSHLLSSRKFRPLSVRSPISRFRAFRFLVGILVLRFLVFHSPIFHFPVAHQSKRDR